jgi:hypothetical protein
MMPLYCLFNLSFLGLRGRHKPTRRRDRISEQEPAEVRPPSFGIVVRPSGTVSSNPLPSSSESTANLPHTASSGIVDRSVRKSAKEITQTFRPRAIDRRRRPAMRHPLVIPRRSPAMHHPLVIRRRCSLVIRWALPAAARLTGHNRSAVQEQSLRPGPRPSTDTLRPSRRPRLRRSGRRTVRCSIGRTQGQPRRHTVKYHEAG